MAPFFSDKIQIPTFDISFLSGTGNSLTALLYFVLSILFGVFFAKLIHLASKISKINVFVMHPAISFLSGLQTLGLIAFIINFKGYEIEYSSGIDFIIIGAALLVALILEIFFILNYMDNDEDGRFSQDYAIASGAVTSVFFMLAAMMYFSELTGGFSLGFLIVSILVAFIAWIASVLLMAAVESL